MLRPVMLKGKRVDPRESLQEIRARCASAVAHLPAALRSLDTAKAYPVEFSSRLAELTERTRAHPGWAADAIGGEQRRGERKLR